MEWGVIQTCPNADILQYLASDNVLGGKPASRPIFQCSRLRLQGDAGEGWTVAEEAFRNFRRGKNRYCDHGGRGPDSINPHLQNAGRWNEGATGKYCGGG